MCTETFVCSEEVVAIVLADALVSLTYSCAELKEAIKSLNIGDTNTTKDFIYPSASTIRIIRNQMNRRRKEVLYRNPQETAI